SLLGGGRGESAPRRGPGPQGRDLNPPPLPDFPQKATVTPWCSVILSQGVGEWGDAAKDGREVTVAQGSIGHDCLCHRYLSNKQVAGPGDLICAGGGTRTRTPSRAMAFESTLSTNSNNPAPLVVKDRAEPAL